MTPNEAQTRKSLIDGQLSKAGWNLRNRDQVRFEVPASGDEENPFEGVTDYSLYLENGEIIAIVEAKRQSRSPQTARQQALIYAERVERNQSFRPFVFLANGNEIWFWDTEEETPREVAGFFSQADLERLLFIKQNKLPLADASIDADISGRLYQQEAIRRVAKTFDVDKKRRALLVMATGTGKTRTSMGLIDLFLRTNQARKVLFLADRDALVDQALTDGFREHLPQEPNDRIFTHQIDKTKRLYVATLHTIGRCFEEFSPAFFDLIIFDEAHRSIFNKLGEVIEYFDARMIGLTATPANFVDRDTFLLFDCPDGIPTFCYSYSQAIQDSILVDYSLYQAQTKFQREGIKGVDLSEEDQNLLIEQGIDPDAIDYSGTEIEKTVSDKDTLRKQWEEIWEVCLKDQSGQLPGKTIIFAMTQAHAERLMLIFEEMHPQFKDLVRVITSDTERVRDGSWGDGLITRFKKYDQPRIAISVDMLDTGIDVPEIVNLIFMKPVRSRIKLEQMIGRGTRSDETCKYKDRLPDGKKTEFKIIDFWENDFNKQAEEVSRQSVPVLVTVFNTRLNIARLYLRKQDSEDFRATIGGLREMVRRIPLDSYQVKKAFPKLAHVWEDSYWEFWNQNKLDFLRLKIAPLLRFVPDVDVQAETFTSKVERLKYQILTDKVTESTIESIQEDVSRLPNFVLDKPLCKEAAELCLSGRLQTASPKELNAVIRNLAPEMKNRREKENLFIQLDLPDYIATRGYITLSEGGERIYVEEYRERVERKINDLIETHPTVLAVRHGEAVSDEQLIELERILRKTLSSTDVQLTTENIRKAYGLHVKSLLGFVRHVLELESLPNYETVVSRKFDEFGAQHNYNEDQLNFLRALKSEFLRKHKLEEIDFYDNTAVRNFGMNAADRLFTESDRAEILEFTREIAA
jgi:type I restriction enzyme R subunit